MDKLKELLTNIILIGILIGVYIFALFSTKKFFISNLIILFISVIVLCQNLLLLNVKNNTIKCNEINPINKFFTINMILMSIVFGSSIRILSDQVFGLYKIINFDLILIFGSIFFGFIRMAYKSVLDLYKTYVDNFKGELND